MSSESLQALAAAGAFLAPPAAPGALERLSADLAAAALPALPPDLLAFLDGCDGLLFDGATLQGADPHQAGRADLPGLLAVNRPSLGGDRLVLGGEADALYVWDAPASRFRVLDRLDKALLEEYAGFDDFFADAILRRL